jgi:endonuclease-3
MKKEKIKKIFYVLKEDYQGKDKIELNYVNNFTMLVAIILSAQATDKGVNKATKELFKIAKTPYDFVELGLEKIKFYIKSINFFNNKAKYILNMSKNLIKNFNSKVPRNLEKLISLEEVGTKTAKVFLNHAFKESYIGVDTHVFRLSNRLGIVDEKTVKKTDEKLNKIIPEKYKTDIGHWMVLHGRYVCKSRRPLCEKCSLKEFCNYYNNRL